MQPWVKAETDYDDEDDDEGSLMEVVLSEELDPLVQTPVTS